MDIRKYLPCKRPSGAQADDEMDESKFDNGESDHDKSDERMPDKELSDTVPTPQPSSSTKLPKRVFTNPSLHLDISGCPNTLGYTAMMHRRVSFRRHSPL